MSEGWTSTQRFVKIEPPTTDVPRLKVDYAMCGLEPIRQKILVRRALSILAAEEARLYALTDDQAIKELDALMKRHDGEIVQTTEQS